MRITRYVDSYDTYISGEGKEGYVVLLLQPEGGKHPPEECHICVGVGSKMIKNISVIHPTFGEYAVNFTPTRKGSAYAHLRILNRQEEWVGG
ncbi:hypothetical protein [Methanogenium cariaci]|uniref:hypothetical protein n=1 Tax=Methanogenium cariaci TaxID=2197 RepID=UPI0012F7076A|nr:hypothetical protein [Methanogenium cariaci]